MNVLNELGRGFSRIRTQITDEKLFSSSEFNDFAKSTVRAVMYRLPRNVNYEGFYAEDSNTTAYTDGDKVTVNYASPLTRNQKTRNDKYLSIIGQIIHEVGHVLFTDFPEYDRMADCFVKNAAFSFYPAAVNTLPEAEEIIVYFNDNPELRSPAFEIMHNLCNILEDSYIERMLHKIFGGDLMKGLHVTNMENIRYSGTFSEMSKDMKEINRISLFLNCIHISTMENNIHDVVKGDELIPEQEAMWSEWKKLYSGIKPLLDEHKTAEDTQERFVIIDRIFIALWPYVRPILELMKKNRNEEKQSQDVAQKQGGSQDAENGGRESSQSSTQSSNGNDKNNLSDKKESSGSESSEKSSDQISSSDTNDQASSDRKDESEKSDVFETGSGENQKEEESHQKVKDDARSASADEKKAETDGNDEPDSSSESKEDAEKNAEEIIRKMAEENSRSPKGNTKPVTEKELEKASEKGKISPDHGLSEVVRQMTEDEFNREVKDEFIKNICNTPQELDSWKFEFRNPDTRTSYPVLNEREMDSIVLPASRKLKQVIKEKQKTGYSSGYHTGRFNAKDYIRTEYKNDGKWFRRRFEPDDIDVCFYIRIDLSGSMRGKKSVSAAKAAIAISRILDSAGIPYAVVGDNVDWYDTRMYVYKTFNEIKFNYRSLASIPYDVGGCNRDGAAIRFGRDKLEKRNEKKKVLISISDGQPTCNGYDSRVSPIEDTIKEVTDCRRKGINVIGVCIDDYNNIKRIYGTHSLDMTDLNGLPSRLAGLVSRIALH